MWIGLICLFLCLGVPGSEGFRKSNGRTSLTGLTRVYNLGSDELVRPDDENSPEFKAYLRKLLQMQANRAKSGHGAPSSASSDAYFAKLTRIKIERNERIQAGLDDKVNTSYRPEDFENARYESAEPAVRAQALGAGVTRAPDPSEIEARNRALEKIKAEQDGRTLDESEYARVSAAVTRRQRPESGVRVDQKELDVIDRLVQGGERGVGIPSPFSHTRPHRGERKIRGRADIKRAHLEARARREAVMAGRDPDEAAARVRLEDHKAIPETVRISEDVQQELTKATQPTRVPVSEPVSKPAYETAYESVGEAPAIATHVWGPEPEVMAVAAPTAPAPSAHVAATVGDQKLSKSELKVAAQALHALVSHRGGGGFGKGRLTGVKATDLEEKLVKAVQMIKSKDAGITSTAADGAAATATTATATSTATRVSRPEPVPNPKFSSEPMTTAAPVRTPAVVATTPELSNVVPLEATTVPQQGLIAKGLNDFLRDPAQLSGQQLASLRDGLIQCLSMVSQEIAASSDRDNSGGVTDQVLPSQPQQAGEYLTEPIPAGEYITEPIPRSLGDELRMTLSLLLKHRGGPGFGHGRLQGRELESLRARLTSVSEKLRREIQEVGESTSEARVGRD